MELDDDECIMKAANFLRIFEVTYDFNLLISIANIIKLVCDSPTFGHLKAIESVISCCYFHELKVEKHALT